MSTDGKRTSWSRPVDLASALAGGPPSRPTVGEWSDGKQPRALFYPNEVHSVFGDPESMKSWLLLYAAVKEIKLGNHVFFVDMEANDRSIVERLVLLGSDQRDIKRQFHYFRPDDQINVSDQAKLRALVGKHKPTLVVLDGVTEAFSIHGLSINSAEDAAAWFRSFARQFQVKPTAGYDGPAIVELDHVVKSQDARNGWALGTIHKKAGIKGAAYQVVSRAPFGKGRHGVSRLILEKDSPGGVEWVAIGKDRRRLVGELHCDATGDCVDAWIEAPDPASDKVDGPDLPLVETYEFRLLMQAVSAYVVKNPGCSTRQARDNVVGTHTRVASALEALAAEGYLAKSKGRGNAHEYVSLKDFTAMKVVPGGAR